VIPAGIPREDGSVHTGAGVIDVTAVIRVSRRFSRPRTSHEAAALDGKGMMSRHRTARIRILISPRRIVQTLDCFDNETVQILEEHGNAGALIQRIVTDR
jgi:hypothetical protein